MTSILYFSDRFWWNRIGISRNSDNFCTQWFFSFFFLCQAFDDLTNNSWKEEKNDPIVPIDNNVPRIHKICMIWERGVVQNFRDVRDTGSMPRVALVIENWKLKTPFWAGEGRKISPSWHMSGSTFAVSMRMEHPSENTEKPRRNLAKPAHDSDTDPKK
jgi:hypothetical protein